MVFSNMGAPDRTGRVAIGLLMLGVGWWVCIGTWAFPLRVFALYPVITGLVGWCPIYALLSLSSRKR